MRGSPVPENRWDLLPAGGNAPLEVSVVIPHYDAQGPLDQVLRALQLQTHPASRLEVIVADDGSPTPPSLAEAGGLRTRLVGQERAGFRAAAARNHGAAVAEGELLCFLDADTVPEPGYVAAVAGLAARSSELVVVGRRRHARLQGWSPSRVADWLTGAGPGPTELPEPAWLARGLADSAGFLHADDRSFRFVISAVLSLGRALFDEVGGFEESFTSYGGEDWELAHRLWTAGALLAYEPTAVAWHDGPDWAGRGGTDALARKNAETLRLAELIPEPSMRGAATRYAVPDTVVILSGEGWKGATAAAASLTVESLLSARDVHVWGAPAGVAGGDPRVQVGTTGPPAGVLLRARHRVVLPAPAQLDLAAVLARLGPGRAGRVTVADADGVLCVAERARALGRSRRWGRDLVATCFGEETVDAAEVGASRLPAEPDLAAHFGGWA